MTDSGLTIDGVAVPLAIEAAGDVLAYVRAQQRATPSAAAPVESPHTFDEGDE